MLRWYSASIKELELFFGTTAHGGLGEELARQRIKKAGKVIDPLLPEAAARFYKVKVWRSGTPVVISSQSLVTGDLVELTTGDRVPADIRLIKVQALHADEALITGNSHPVSKSTNQLKDKLPIAEQKNMVFAGSYIKSGSGLGIVTATGSNTECAKTYTKPRLTIRRRSLLVKLSRMGIITQNIKVLRSQVKGRVAVIIDYPITANEIHPFIHKNQERLENFIFCVTKEYAGVLASELKLDVYYPSNKKLYNGQNIVAVSSSEDIKAIIVRFKRQSSRVLIATSNVHTYPALAAADYVCLTDTSLPDSVKMKADFFMPNADINTIEKLVLTLDK